MSNALPGSRVRFAAFEVDVLSGELCKRGIRIKLQDQPLKILLALLERPGEIVTREELRQRIWGSDTFVDFDHGLSAAVNRLREALGDSAEKPRYVETVARRGYRFIALVERGLKPAAPPRPAPARHGWAIASAVLSLAVTGLLLWRWLTPPALPPELRAVPLVRLPGAGGWGSFSPDGKQFAFSWSTELESRSHIYVQQIGSGNSLRRTTGMAEDYNPVFSPDGNWIAFLRYPVFLGGRSREAIFVMPVLEGPARMIAPAWVPGLMRALAWGPDGHWLIVAASPTEEEPCALMAFPVGGGEPHRLTKPPASAAVADTSPVLSPDGRQVAFLRNWTWGVRCCAAFADGDVFVQTIHPDLSPDGEPRQVSHEKCCVSDVAWTGGGRELLYVVWREGAQRIVRIAASGRGSPQLVPSLGPVGRDIVVSPHGNKLAYSTSGLYGEIWQLEPEAHPATPVRLISSAHGDIDPRFSPDGRKIAFISARSGPWSLWVSDSDGSNPVEVASLDGGVAAPRWSPDGREIAFTGRSDGNSDIWVVEATGGRSRRLTRHPASDGNPAWSPDGRWIYFTSNRTGRQELFRMPARPADGSGQAQPLKTDGGHTAFASPDGRFIYFTKTLYWSPLWRVPAEGGEQVQVTPPGVYAHAFEVTQDGLWFQKALPGYFGFQLARYRFDTDTVEELTKMPRPIDLGFSISPAPGPHRKILFAMAGVRTGDIYLVENFR